MTPLQVLEAFTAAHVPVFLFADGVAFQHDSPDYDPEKALDACRMLHELPGGVEALKLHMMRLPEAA